VAEIFPNGEVLGTVTTSFYKNGNAVRVANGASYADRNITITPQNQPSAAVKIRLYMSKKEYEALDGSALSGITSISDVRIHKNSDPCQSAITTPTTIINPGFASLHGDSGYVFQADISGFSTFYFASANLVLPINSLTFTGSYKNAVSYLKWETKNEINTDHFELERSVTGTDFQKIRDITATGSPDSKTRYTYNDQNVLSLGVARLFYRLKVVDTDGAYTYSKVVVVDLPNSMITNIAIFPNPADKQTTALVTSSKEQTIKWQLVDVSGRVMISKDYVLRKGENRIIIDLAALRVGTYFFQISGQSINVREKIQKL
ncbi:MAG: T9SS type A sorting domain-containing protein, partial [Chitinophagaceae bacterium]